MNLSRTYESLCKPAQFYLILSMVAYVFMILQNLNSKSTFSLGSYQCNHDNPSYILLLNAVYIIIWTWLLNMICKINPNISWFIVLFPFILLFIAMFMILFK
jgi:hypothetical protein